MNTTLNDPVTTDTGKSQLITEVSTVLKDQVGQDTFQKASECITQCAGLGKKQTRAKANMNRRHCSVCPSKGPGKTF